MRADCIETWNTNQMQWKERRTARTCPCSFVARSLVLFSFFSFPRYPSRICIHYIPFASHLGKGERQDQGTSMEAEANGADAVMATGAVDASEAARQSQKDCRVYVGNLSYEVKGDNLKEFMRAGAC